MKGAAVHQMEAVVDATSSLSKGVHKTIRNCSREVSKVADEWCGFTDFDDIFRHASDHVDEGMRD